MEMAIITSFQSATTSSPSGSINKKWQIRRMSRAEKVIRLGATQDGKNLRRYVAKGDHKYS